MSDRRGRAAVLTDGVVATWDVPVPPPDRGGLVLRVELGGVCGTDVHLVRGEVPLPFPLVLGHEGVGVVEELGETVETDYAGNALAVGDRVIWVPMRSCGRCRPCTVELDPTRCDRLLLFGPATAPSWGSYAEFAWLPDGMPFYRIPNGTPSDAVIAFGCALPTMLQALERIGGIRPGGHVVIQGSGPVGLAATMLARLSGADRVVVIGGPEHRLGVARQLGASATIDITEIPDPADRAARVRELTDGRGGDVVVEAAGVLPAFTEGISLVAHGGHYLVVGLWSAAGTAPIEPRAVNNGKLSIVGSAFAAPRHYHQALMLTRAHHERLPLAKAVTHRFPVDAASSALQTSSSLESVKAVIVGG